jgi:hypothetical protein
MGAIMGKSMRFVIHLPIATGRRLVRNAAAMGLPEYAYVATALAVGDTSLAQSTRMMKNLTPAQAKELVRIVIGGGAHPARKTVGNQKKVGKGKAREK